MRPTKLIRRIGCCHNAAKPASFATSDSSTTSSGSIVLNATAVAAFPSFSPAALEKLQGDEAQIQEYLTGQNFTEYQINLVMEAWIDAGKDWDAVSQLRDSGMLAAFEHLDHDKSGVLGESEWSTECVRAADVDKSGNVGVSEMGEFCTHHDSNGATTADAAFLETRAIGMWPFNMLSSCCYLHGGLPKHDVEEIQVRDANRNPEQERFEERNNPFGFLPGDLPPEDDKRGPSSNPSSLSGHTDTDSDTPGTGSPGSIPPLPERSNPRNMRFIPLGGTGTPRDTS
ncbi:unnamed protein product [Amoebophrya sp. A120]|nr:unnamed protein product [Amoebophrya sp. A120]|eukprot:GSA120T00019993001.1